MEVPTLEGKVKLKIPEGTQTGKKMRLSGKGIKSLRSSNKGDLYCHIVVETPVNLTEKQQELLREFDAISTGHNTAQHPKSKSFMDKLKDLFD